MNEKISVARAVRMLKDAQVVAYPTETAYGLGANALEAGAVKKIYELKERPKNMKLPIIVSSVEDLKGIAYVNELGKYLSRHLHPGPLNLVVNSNFPWIGTFRISSSPIASKMVKMTGFPITATSANVTGKRTAFSPSEVKLKVPVVDGPILKGPVSTIYDPFTWKMLRKGALSEIMIKMHVVAFGVLERIKPSNREREKVLKIADNVLTKIKKFHKKSIIGGSVAKGTFLKSLNDIDVFLMFPKRINLEDKLDFLKDIAKKFSKSVKVSYAQHPYVRAKYEGIWVEIVPAYDTKPPEVLSAADRSRWHVEFVKSLPSWLLDEILIFKQFCKGVGIYGADSRVEGFSAYAMEVLTAKYGGFIKTLENIEKMKWPIKCSDPVDKKRNVLASVSKDGFEKAKKAAECFLKNPKESFFFPNKPDALKKLPKLGNKALVKFKEKEENEDAAWGSTKRKARKIERNAKLHGFLVVKKSVNVGKNAWAIFEIVTTRENRIKGPPVSKEEHAKKFKEVHKKWFEEKGKIYAIEPNKISFSELVESLEKAKVFEKSRIQQVYDRMHKAERLWLSGFFGKKETWDY